jgi:hypothetical protein
MLISVPLLFAVLSFERFLRSGTCITRKFSPMWPGSSGSWPAWMKMIFIGSKEDCKIGLCEIQIMNILLLVIMSVYSVG